MRFIPRRARTALAVMVAAAAASMAMLAGAPAAQAALPAPIPPGGTLTINYVIWLKNSAAPACDGVVQYVIKDAANQEVGRLSTPAFSATGSLRWSTSTPGTYRLYAIFNRPSCVIDPFYVFPIPFITGTSVAKSYYPGGSNSQVAYSFHNLEQSPYPKLINTFSLPQGRP